MLKATIFVVVSALLAYGSRASLRVPRSHGFYRFFAAEFVLALVLLNVNRWFEDPFSPQQLVSWFLLAASIVLVVSATYMFRQQGGQDGRRHDDVPLAGFEKTTRLLATGIFKYIRHPMYASGLYGTWGVFLKDPSVLGGFLAIVATAFWLATAKVEEIENVRYFGAAYESYAQRTKMFVPFLL